MPLIKGIQLDVIRYFSTNPGQHSPKQVQSALPEWSRQQIASALINAYESGLLERVCRGLYQLPQKEVVMADNTAYTEIVMALDKPDENGGQTFHSIYDGDDGFPPGHAVLTLSSETWKSLGRPDMMHVYAPEFIQVTPEMWAAAR